MWPEAESNCRPLVFQTKANHLSFDFIKVLNVKRFILFIIIIFLNIPSIAFAHPGNTDGQGGHTCRTNCNKWGLNYNQYHFHNSKPQTTPSQPTTPTSVDVSELRREIIKLQNTINEYEFTEEQLRISKIREENFSRYFLYFAIAIFLYMTYADDRNSSWNKFRRKNLTLFIIFLTIGVYFGYKSNWNKGHLMGASIAFYLFYLTSIFIDD